MRKIRVWLNERRKRLQQLKAANEALWGVYFDKAKLMDILESADKDDLVINVYTIDGTRIEIKRRKTDTVRRSHWDD